MKFHLFSLDTINKRLLLPTLLMVTILVGALGSLLLVQQQRLLTSMMESKANSLTSMLSSISVQYVVNYDLSALEIFVKETVKDKEIAFAEYYDTDGKSLTSDIMKAPADTSRLLVYQRGIVGGDGRSLGMVKLGFETDELEQILHRSVTIMVGSLAVILGLLAFGQALIVNSVTRPMNDAITVAKRVADGDLTQQIRVKSRDETGQLLRALKDMLDKLTGIVSGVRRTTESITSAAQQVAAGNSNLSQRTEQQASSLQETASSMEELAETVKQNAEHADQASRLAQGTGEIAAKGGEAVNKVVNTMTAINDSSKKIADIIGVIEGIAFQTNILALNAAVEAARAGEQGRGFAVVASEVRSLAQRSADAAKEIKFLIGNSVDKVGVGTQQVEEAAEVIGDIITSVDLVIKIVAEISSSTKEQSSGINQVNQAITQMDEMTQQNAALVEEAAAAAESMQEQSLVLTAAVHVFKLDKSNGNVQTAVSKPAVAPSAVTIPASFREGTDGEWKEI